MSGAAIKKRVATYSAAALRDLDGIYDYIANDSLTAADKFVSALVDDVARIARLGVTGVARDWISPGLKLHIFGKYCVYFRTDDKRLLILRIVHGARDLAALDFDSVDD